MADSSPSKIIYYWEDLLTGSERDLGTITATREEIIAFASQFDPQGLCFWRFVCQWMAYLFHGNALDGDEFFAVFHQPGIAWS